VALARQPGVCMQCVAVLQCVMPRVCSVCCSRVIGGFRARTSCISSCMTGKRYMYVLQCVAVCCSVLQCVAVCCSVLQCVAVCCSVFRTLYVNMCEHV